MKRFSIITLSMMLMALGASAARAGEADKTGLQALAQYQKIQAALSEDSIAGVREAAARIAETVEPCACSAEERAASRAVAEAARGVKGTDLATLREQFGRLSKAMATYLKIAGVDSSQLYYCPMAKAYWLQPRTDGASRNPYLGKAMPTCGLKVETVAE